MNTFSTDNMEADMLAEKLMEARYAYYSTDTPLLSDFEFDRLEEELKRISPGHPYFSTVGIKDDSEEKIRHKVPMLSMGKAKTIKEVIKWFEKIIPVLKSETVKLVVQPKVDGLSASLMYRNGNFEYAATRGDGYEGKNISHIVEYIKDIPDKITFSSSVVEIRGELHLPKNTPFDTKGRPLRNNCAGLINRKDDFSDLKYVKFLAYQIIWPDKADSSAGSATVPPGPDAEKEPRLYSEYGKIDLLSENGFYTFDKWLVTYSGDINRLSGELEDLYKEYIEQFRDLWNFETDGLIIAVDDNRLHEKVDSGWVVDHHHHYAIAFKPPSQSAETVLEEILWQVSRQGTLTPVARFKPVTIVGAVLEKASLHNARNVVKLKLVPGDRILVERANDVIPYVRENISAENRTDDFDNSGELPEKCPSCGTDVQWQGVNLVCINPECRERVLQSILFWIRQAGVEQVALKTLEALYDAGKLRNIKDLYTLKAEDFSGIEGFGEKKTENFLNQIKKSAKMSAVELISRLGIPMVQKKSLAKLNIKTLEDFLDFSDDSYVIGAKIIEWKNNSENIDFLKRLLEVIEIENSDSEQDRQIKGVICFTGKAPVPRKTLIEEAEKKGWSVSGSVTKDTVMVVCENPSGNSSKLTKARSAGIPVITYNEFIKNEKIKLTRQVTEVIN